MARHGTRCRLGKSDRLELHGLGAGDRAMALCPLDPIGMVAAVKAKKLS